MGAILVSYKVLLKWKLLQEKKIIEEKLAQKVFSQIYHAYSSLFKIYYTVYFCF